MNEKRLQKAEMRGEPSYVWRAGQERRLRMILEAAGERAQGRVLVDGCGVGEYLAHLAQQGGQAVGLDIELERTQQAQHKTPRVVCAACEVLPFPSHSFDLVLSHEVLEHVQDAVLAISEIVRVLQPGGRLVLFVPNRGYPFETHGIRWRGKYHFGNIPLVNWLPRKWRDKLAPHVDVYTRRDLERLFSQQPVRFIERTVIFGAYDNIIYSHPRLGRALRSILQALEKTPLRGLGLSHVWVVEKSPLL